MHSSLGNKSETPSQKTKKKEYVSLRDRSSKYNIIHVFIDYYDRAKSGVSVITVTMSRLNPYAKIKKFQFGLQTKQYCMQETHLKSYREAENKGTDKILTGKWKQKQSKVDAR